MVGPDETQIQTGIKPNWNKTKPVMARFIRAIHVLLIQRLVKIVPVRI